MKNEEKDANIFKRLNGAKVRYAQEQEEEKHFFVDGAETIAMQTTSGRMAGQCFSSG